MKNKLLTLFLALAASVGISFAETYSGTCGDNLTWTLDTESGILTISGTGAMTNYDSYPWYSYRSSIKTVIIEDGVTSIGIEAFSGCSNLTAVELPNSIYSIHYGAFAGCINLTQIDIPNNCYRLYQSVFGGCTGLKTVTIPSSLSIIEYYVFRGCTGLESINVASDNNSYCSVDGVLFDKNKNKLVCYPPAKNQDNYLIPNSVTNIAHAAFIDCINLTTITIPNNVVNIEERAFWNNSVMSIVVQREIPPTAEDAFSCTNISNIYVPCGTIDAYKSSWSNYANIIRYKPSQYILEKRTNIAGAGQIVNLSDLTICDNSTTIEAIPNSGYNFVQWSDGETTNPRTIIVTQDTAFTAEFATSPDIFTEKHLSGYFSVGADKTVKFSQGNLQYRAVDNMWRFANEQYDVISWEQNKQLSQTCNQWIDLFKFASSGYNGFYPWADITYNTSESITNTNYDWGVYNPIVNGGNKAGMWRTLTISEWTYLFNGRKNANSLFGYACINGINGLIVLPDGFNSTTFYIDYSHNDYSNNVLTIEQWQQYENEGAIFLPANGRIPLGNQSNHDGFYWSSTADNGCNGGYADVGAYAWFFYNRENRSTDPDWMQDRRSVRLVRDTIVDDLATIYTITWQDEDGNVIKTDEVEQGTTPAFTGTTPTKMATNEYTYEFAGWLPKIQPATKDICYTTFFERNKIETPGYTVNINGENCSLNINNQYPEGTVITLEAVADECFEFQQWSDGNKDNPRTITVTANTNLTAEFNKVRYTVTGELSTGGKVQISKQ